MNSVCHYGMAWRPDSTTWGTDVWEMACRSAGQQLHPAEHDLVRQAGPHNRGVSRTGAERQQHSNRGGASGVPGCGCIRLPGTRT